MTTVGDLVERTRVHLAGNLRSKATALGAAVSSTTTTSVTVASADPYPANGDYIACDYEVMRVTAGGGTASLTVVRGELGTTAATHASGATVEISPRFARGLILAAMIDEIRSWPRGVYAVRTVPVNYPAFTGVAGLLVAGNVPVYGILDMKRQLDDGSSRWKKPSGVLLDGFIGTYASGYAVQLRHGVVYSSAQSCLVTYSCGFDLSSVDQTTDIADVGLSDSMQDIPPLGTASRLLIGREVDRTDARAQGQSGRQSDVPAMYTAKTADFFRQARDRRLDEEAFRLQERWGVSSR